MSEEAVRALIAAIATLLSTAMAILAAFLLVKKNELEKAKIDCVRRLFAYRFVLAEGGKADAASMANYLAAINEVPFLFAKYPAVLAAHRDARANGRTPEALVKLLRAITPHIAVDFTNLSDDDICGLIVAPTRSTSKMT